MQPIYFAVYVPSYSLFEHLKTADKRIAAQVAMHDWISTLVLNQDKRFKQQAVEVSYVGGSMYATLLPEILMNRTKEIEECRIHYSITTSEKERKNRYYIGDLVSTHYGQQVIEALGISYSLPVVGEATWLGIVEALQDLGLDLQSMMVEISGDDWSDFVKRQMYLFDQQDIQSKELDALRAVSNARRELSSPELDTRLKGLEALFNSKTAACNDKLFPLAKLGTIQERRKAIGFLVDVGGPDVESLLSEMIGDSSDVLRPQIAEGLSILASFDFARGSREVFIEGFGAVRVSLAEMSETGEGSAISLFGNIASSMNPMARIEAARALSHLQSPGAQQVLFRMINDEDARVRGVLLDTARYLPHELAGAIVAELLTDEEHTIREQAKLIGEERWPEQEW
ncbi:MAG: HEAT repeat domain-containing protein [Candidatus Thorarchaeota archaeon]|jgi:hypothetical protein